MKKIKELHDKETNVEIEATVIAIPDPKVIWKCFSCKDQSTWDDKRVYEGKCIGCGAKPCSSPGKGVWEQKVLSVLVDDKSGRAYFDLWNNDSDEFKEAIVVGDVLHIYNAYSKVVNGKTFITKSREAGYRKIIK